MPYVEFEIDRDNAARFGNPLDFGYLTENVADKLANDLRTYGQFHLHYVPRNLAAA